MRKLISCGTMKFSLIYIILAPCMNSIMHFMALIINKQENLKLNLLTETLVMYISQIIAGLGILYSCSFNSKSKSIYAKETLNTVHQFEIERPSEDPYKEKNDTLFISGCLLFFSFISFAQTIILLYMILKHVDMIVPQIRSNLDFELSAINMIYISFLSRYYLNYSLYYHQIVSLSIIFFGICLVFIPSLPFDKDLHIKIPIYLLQNFLSSLRYVCEKWLMEKKSVTPYHILFYEGIIGTLMTIILGSLGEVIPFIDSMFGTVSHIYSDIMTCFTVKKIMLIHTAIVIISCALYNLLMVLIRYHYTPMHCCISNLITSFIMWVIFCFNKKVISKVSYIIAIGYCFLFIGSLIYNEIVICYFCDLQEYTAIEITKRSKMEYQIAENESLVEFTQDNQP